MNTNDGDSTERRLFIGGERLRIDVEATTQGGGDKFEPQTPQEARALLLPMIESVVRRAATLPSHLRGERVYVEAQLLPNYLAASHFPDVLLKRVNAVPVGSRASTGIYRTKSMEKKAITRRLILAFEDEGLNLFRTLVDRPDRARADQQAFKEIRKFETISMAGSDEVVLDRPQVDTQVVTWEAVLHPSTTVRGEPEPLDPATMEKWFTYVESLGGHNYRDYARRVGGLTFAPVALASAQVDQLAQFNPLRALRPMPAIRPRPLLGIRSVSRLAPPLDTQPAETRPRVAIFDGGVHPSPSSPGLFPSQSIDCTPEPPDPEYLDHGTGVTGAVMYGLTREDSTVQQPPCPVDSFRVFPAPRIPRDLKGYWLLDQIKKIVVDNGYDIVNLSLGPRLAVDDSTEPNRWTSELDQLASEHNVLFVVAAGNDGALNREMGLHRVQVPGDMVNGITVGACDLAPPEPQWKRGPYSSMGPGRHGNRIQPAGVQFGGSVENPFPVLCADGTFGYSIGTSYSTPLVTHALSKLATRLPVATPSVLRAFALHYAERHRTYKKLIDEIGHGRFPLDFEPVLESRSNEAHILFVDEIERGNLIGYELPVPAATNGPLKVKITLAYLSPVDPSQPTEYTRASLDLVFRPNHFLHRFTPPNGSTSEKPVTLDYTSEGALKLLTRGWKMSQEPINRTLSVPPGSSEVALRDAGKWETIRHHRINLALNEAKQPRLELSYLARRAGWLDDSPSAVPFALITTIRDDSEGSDLYDRVRAEFRNLTPLPQNQTQIRAMRAQVSPGLGGTSRSVQ